MKCTVQAAKNNSVEMAALVNHVKTLYEAKLYEDVKTMVSMEI